MLVRAAYELVYDLDEHSRRGKLEKYAVNTLSKTEMDDLSKIKAYLSEGKWVLVKSGMSENEASGEEARVFNELPYSLTFGDIVIALNEGITDDFIQMMIKQDKVNLKDSADNTPIFYAAKIAGKLGSDSIKKLVEAGADIHYKNPKGNTVLHAAADSGCIDNLALFATIGMDMDVKNTEGKDYLAFISNQHIRERVLRNMNVVYAALAAKINQGPKEAPSKKVASL